MENNLLTGLNPRKMGRNFPCVKIDLVGGGILFRGTNEFSVRMATERFGDSLSIVPRLKRKEEDHFECLVCPSTTIGITKAKHLRAHKTHHMMFWKYSWFPYYIWNFQLWDIFRKLAYKMIWQIQRLIMHAWKWSYFFERRVKNANSQGKKGRTQQ